MLQTLIHARTHACLHAARGLVVLFAALVVLPGCSSFGSKLESPELSLVGIQMLSTDMFAQKFKVRVLVCDELDRTNGREGSYCVNFGSASAPATRTNPILRTSDSAAPEHLHLAGTALTATCTRPFLP